MRKNKIVKLALHELLDKGIEMVNINKISKTTHLKEDKIRELFPKGDSELLMDVVEYAGVIWTKELRIKLNSLDDRDEKAYVLIKEYVLGTKVYSQSLSIYIDLWKIIKDNKDEYIKYRLKNIYNIYANEFTSQFVKISKNEFVESELKAMSYIITILSDVVHLQAITLGNEPDFDSLESIIRKISKALLEE